MTARSSQADASGPPGRPRSSLRFRRTGRSYEETRQLTSWAQSISPDAFPVVSRMFSEIGTAKTEGTYLEHLARVMKNKLLLIDDFGLEPPDHTARMALLEFLEDRHRGESTLIVSQQPVASWQRIIADPTIADAIMDRLAFNFYRIEITGDTARRKLSAVD